MLGYRVPAPDEAMLISGGKQKAEGGGQFRIVTGHGAWVAPFFRKVRFLSLEMHTVDFAEKCYTNHGITINVSAVVAFKVDNSPNAITAAAQRFLNNQKKGQMEELTKKIFVGHLRGICGRMTVEEIIQNREKLTMEVLEGSQSEMSSMGLHVDSMQIETFDDVDGSYIVDMAKPQRAQIEQQAKVAQANANQLSQAAQQESLRKQAQQQRDTAIAEAQYKAEMDKAAAEAAQAGPLAQAEHQQQVIDMQRELAQRNAELREQQLVAEVIKPAEAEAKRVRIDADAQTSASEAAAKRATFEAEALKTKAVKAAEADKEKALLNAEATRAEGEAKAAAAQATGLADAEVVKRKGLAEAAGLLEKAKAAAAEGGAQIELAKVNIQPEIARAVAQSLGLDGANLTILNGGEGLAQLVGTVAALVPQFAQLGGLLGRNGHSNGNGEQTPQPPTVAQAQEMLAAARQSR